MVTKDKKILENTANVLRKLRLRRDILQKDIAGFMGIDDTCYSHMETGKRDLRLSEVWIIADFYGIRRNMFIRMIEKGDIEVAETNYTQEEITAKLESYANSRLQMLTLLQQECAGIALNVKNEPALEILKIDIQKYV